MMKTICTSEGQMNVEMTAEEMAAFETERAVLRAHEDAETLKASAIQALTKSDLVAFRCFKAGVSFPADWQTYVASLRAIVNGAAGPLPEQPEYPEGT